MREPSEDPDKIGDILVVKEFFVTAGIAETAFDAMECEVVLPRETDVSMWRFLETSPE